MIRRAIPLTLLPLTVLAGGLASAPWLRSYPASVIAVPLFGAALLSVLVPCVAVPLLTSRIWLTAVIDLAAFVVYSLLVVLRAPTAVDGLVAGLVHGPSSVLTFALPLVSPRSLLIAPVALCWLAGAIAGECLARRWFSVLPYAAWLVTFGLAWAGTQRAPGDAGQTRLYGTFLAAALLATLLLLRAAQSWVEQDTGAAVTQAGGVLPLRGLVWGVVVTVVVTLFASSVVRSPVFVNRSVAPQRVPSIDQTHPLTPVAFIAGLRPQDPKAAGRAVFDVTLDGSASPYVAIASVDSYDGDGWSFDRTFRPTGGVVPAEADLALRPPGRAITQHYRIDYGPLGSAPWMPAMQRAQQISGTSVNVDSATGMIVPAAPLHGGQSYRVRSAAATTAFEALDPTALPATSTPPADVEVPGPVQAQLDELIRALADETGKPSAPAVPFLKAVIEDFHAHYAMSGGAAKASAAASSAPRTSAPTSAKAAAKPAPSPSTTPGRSPTDRTGSTSFADVLTSIIGPTRAGTPEQYATLFALVARQLGVPARVVTGFRVKAPRPGPLPSGSYHVTTAQAWTWVEIPIRGAGWVVADAAPGTVSGLGQQQSVGAQGSPSPTAPPTQNALITKSNNGHAVAKQSTVPPGARTAKGPIVVAVLLALIALLIVVLSLLLLRKQLRRRRRRRLADPRRRLLGAWRESLDMLTECGMPPLTAMTSTEVASATGAAFGEDPAGRAADIGQAANLAMYSTSPVSAEAADAAWTAHRRLRKIVQSQLGVRARVAAALAYHRSPSSKGAAGPASWAESAGRPARSRRGRLSAGQARTDRHNISASSTSRHRPRRHRSH